VLENETMSSQSATTTPATPPAGRLFFSALVPFVLMLVGTGAVMFGLAGRVTLPAFWAYLLILLAGGVAGTVVTIRTDPSLIQERKKPGPGGKDPKLRFWAMSFFAVHLVVAALDVGRFHWSDLVPGYLQAAGLFGLAASLGLAIWATSANRFFSSDARIQRERGHQLVTDGPYRFIRHPGYAGSVLMALSSPLALGSYVAAILMIPVAGLIVRRLLIEERLLRGELEGYADYMGRVRWRMLPGIW